MSISELDVIEGEVLPAVPQGAAVTLFRSDDPAEVLRRAVETADMLSSAVKDRGLVKKIGGKEYPLIEAWTMLGTLVGVFPVPVWTKQIEGGWHARVEARTRDGAVVGAAEAIVTRGENNWRNRDEYALLSMAQTRASAKALRLPLGFIMTLAGYESTPAEEFIDEKTALRVNRTTGEVVGDVASPQAAVGATGGAEVETAVPADSPAPPPKAPVPDYVPDAAADVPFDSAYQPTLADEMGADPKVDDPAAIARGQLIRRTLGVLVSHGVPATEEAIFDRIEKLSTDGRSVFFGFKGQDFEDLSETQGKKVMDWLEEAGRKHKEGQA